MDELRELLVEISAHHGGHPHHGIDCACMDKYIQKLRKMLAVGDIDLQRRVDYVFRKAIERA